MQKFTEADYEKAVLEIFNGLGYEIVYAPEVERDFTSPFFDEVLAEKISEINSTLPQSAIDEALAKIKNFERGELLQKNEIFTYYLQNGIEVKYFDGGEEKNNIVYLVDYKNIEKNSFIASNQFTFVENSEKRPDIIIFLNGLPVVVMELKSPSREETDISEAYKHLMNKSLKNF